MKTVNVTVRMERRTRDEAARLFSELGISTTQAISMFLKQAAREQRIPFEITARPTVGHATDSSASRAIALYLPRLAHV